MARTPSSQPADQPEPQSQATGPQKKSAPTPSRREAEAARRERLNPTLSPKEAKKRQRQAEINQRTKAMAASDAQPDRKLLRDVIDSRFNLAEIAMPIFLVLLVGTMIPGFASVVNIFLAVTWAYFAAIIVDIAFMWRRFKKLARERLGLTNYRGLLFYGINRAITIRRWRQPPVQVKRGEAI